MKYFIRQKIFTSFDEFDIYNDKKEPCYKVKNHGIMIHQFEFINLKTNKKYYIGDIIFRSFNRFEVKDENDVLLDTLVQDFAFFNYVLCCEKSGLKLKSSWPAIDFTCLDQRKNLIFRVEKAIFNLTDYYEVEVLDDANSDMAIIMMICMDALMYRY